MDIVKTRVKAQNDFTVNDTFARMKSKLAHMLLEDGFTLRFITQEDTEAPREISTNAPNCFQTDMWEDKEIYIPYLYKLGRGDHKRSLRISDVDSVDICRDGVRVTSLSTLLIMAIYEFQKSLYRNEEQSTKEQGKYHVREQVSS